MRKGTPANNRCFFISMQAVAAAVFMQIKKQGHEPLLFYNTVAKIIFLVFLQQQF